MKKRFLVTSLPTNDLGLLTRLLPVAAALRSRGHEVIFSHPAKVPRQMLEKAGFRNVLPRHPLLEVAFYDFSWKKLFGQEASLYGGPLSFVKEVVKCYPYRKLPATDEVWDQDHASAITGLLNYHFIKAQFLAYRGVVEDVRPDAVIDAWNPFACMAARTLKRPLITLNQGDALPEGRGFIWWKDKPDIPSVVPLFNRLLGEFGLESIRQVEDLNVGDVSFVTGIPETDPLRALSDHIYVGPLLWEQPDEVPAWFSGLDSATPVIWLYGGNVNYGGVSKIFDSNTMVEACCQALRGLNVRVILTTGYHNLEAMKARVPDNFLVVDYVPGMMMARRADVMIHHGGYGSCQLSLLTGTPCLVLPTFSERESNARRIAALGAGEMVLGSNAGAKRGVTFSTYDIKEKVLTLLHNRSYAANALAIGKKLAAAGGVKFTVDTIEARLDARRIASDVTAAE